MTWMKGCYSVFLCLSPFIMLPFSPTRPNQIKEACPQWKGVRQKWKKEKSWIFHRNYFIKILLQWNFATREAHTAVSLCVMSRQILAQATKRHPLTWNPLVTKYIHTFTSSARWRLLSIKSEWIFFCNFNTSLLESQSVTRRMQQLGTTC